MNNEDLIDGLHVIARRRGQKIQQGDVEFINAAIEALAKKSARAEVEPSIPCSEILREADHIQENGISLAKFGGQEIHEGRCRELCAMYLREFVQTYHMSERLKALIGTV